MSHQGVVRVWSVVLWTGAFAITGTAAFAQVAPLTIEHRGASAAPGAEPAIVEAAAGAGVTLVFRVTNPSANARNALTHVDVPEGWQVLFVSGRLDVPAQASVVETVTVASPKNAAAGDYQVRYSARLGPTDTPVSAGVTIRIGERRQLSLSWLGAPTYLASGAPATFELLVTNRGNVAEAVTLEVRSGLGLRLQPSWTQGTIAAGATQSVRVIRTPGRVQEGARETLTALLRPDRHMAITEAHLGFDVVPAGRAASPPRSQLPTALAIRAAGTGRSWGFGSFTGGGALNSSRTTMLNFGFVARDRSHPLMFERDRNFLTVTAPGASLAVGDQTWSLSYLTENGHYGLGAGGQIQRRHWSAGAFVDLGRYDVTEGSQAGGFIGLSTGRMVRVSAQYLARFADNLQSTRIADVGSVRLIFKPIASLTADVEAGQGKSSMGTARAVSGQLSFNSRHLSLYGRHVRKDDAYPLRDRTGLIDGAGISLRPFGRFQIEGTLDGTAQIDDPTLPIDAPTRQRTTRARMSWGSLMSVSAGRTEWTRPGQGWTDQWRRESVVAEMHIPVGPLWLAPGYEEGTEATPLYADTRFSLGWLGAGVRLGQRNRLDVRMDYGRGADGDANRTVRRISFGADLQPINATRLTVRLNSNARDALWLQGTQWITASLDQRLPWRHHIVANYQRRSGGSAFVLDSEAYRVDYVVPIGVPLRTGTESGRITVRLRDADTGKAREHMLVQINGQSRLTDRSGVVSFTGLKAGDYHVTVAPDSLGPGQTVLPALPMRVTVKPGGRVDVNATIVRTGKVTGVLQTFQSALAGPPPMQGQAPVLAQGPGIANAIIELQINDEFRTAVTDAQGRFAFDDVPPGTWRLRVARADIPSFYLLEDPQVTVVLASGQTRHLVLRVVPKSQ